MLQPPSSTRLRRQGSSSSWVHHRRLDRTPSVIREDRRPEVRTLPSSLRSKSDHSEQWRICNEPLTVPTAPQSPTRLPATAEEMTNEQGTALVSAIHQVSRLLLCPTSKIFLDGLNAKCPQGAPTYRLRSI